MLMQMAFNREKIAVSRAPNSEQIDSGSENTACQMRKKRV